MADSQHPQICDQLLEPLLAKSNDSEVEKLIAALIHNHAEPLIAGILRQKFAGWRDVDWIEDLQSEVTLRLLGRLKQFKQNPEAYSIWNFRDYVAATTGRVCVNYLRSRHPNRSRLKNSLMYLLTRDKSFFLKENQNGIPLCGLSEWKNVDQPHQISDQNLDFKKIVPKIKSGYLNASSLRIVLTEVFSISGGPIELNELIKLMVATFGIHEPETLPEPELFEQISDHRNNPEETTQNVQFLKKMWDEIKKLPAKQRAALLLNLKDSEGSDLLSVIPLHGIATFREIARILELSLEQFGAIWREIPLGDLKIAEILSVTRQQVINLRKAARERLIRRASDDYTNKNQKSTSIE